MKRLSRILVFIVLVSCSGNITSVRHETFDAAKRLMQARPDSALGLLCDADTTGFTRADRAKYALLLSQALDKNYIDLQSDSIIRPAVEYYSRRGRVADRAWAYYYLARIHTNAGNLEAAIRAYVSAEHYALRTDDYNLHGLLYANMGKLYYSQYDLSEALQMYNKSIDAYRKTDNLYNLERSLYAIAKIHYLSAQYVEALDYYRQAKDIATERSDSAQIADINICIAATLLHDPATPNIDTVIRIVDSVYDSRPYQSSVWPLVCYYYFKTGQHDSTRRYADMIINNLDNYSGWAAAGAYRILSLTSNDVNNCKIRHYKILDSLQSGIRKQFIAELDEKYRGENAHNSYVLQKRINLYQKLVILLLIAIALAVVYTIMHNIKIKTNAFNEAARCIEDLQNDYTTLKARYDVMLKKINLSDENAAILANALKRRIENMKIMIEDLNMFESNPDKLIKRFKEYTRLEYDKTAFHSLCAVVNVFGHGIVDYLRKTYPKLSDSEIQLCCLLCLGFSTPCIRHIFNHSNLDSIYSIRFRVRAKLGLERDVKLESFLNDKMLKLSTEQENMHK